MTIANETNSKLYYEAHVTIEPVFKESLAWATELAKEHGFKIANLLMQKREKDTAERSKYDTFMTGHNNNYGELKESVIKLVKSLQAYGFKVWRYKIEDTITDSRSHDTFGIL